MANAMEVDDLGGAESGTTVTTRPWRGGFRGATLAECSRTARVGEGSGQGVVEAMAACRVVWSHRSAVWMIQKTRKNTMPHSSTASVV